MSIEYKGMIVEQQSDRNVSIYRSDGMMLVYAYVSKVLTEEALERLASRLIRIFMESDRRRTMYLIADGLGEM